MTRILAAMWLLTVTLSFAAGWVWRSDRAATAEARQQAGTSAAAVQQVQAARTTEHKQASTLAAIGDKHEEDRTAAEAIPAAVAADLRADRLRLQKHWAGCETQRLSDAAASAIERDALAKLRDEAAGRIIRIGRDADDQVRACQAVIAADRQ